MSRLTSMSPEALKAIFSPETDSNLITTVTIYDPDNVNNVILRLCDSFTKRISETTEEVIYGITWKGNDYTFLPMEISLPTEEQGQAPKCSITMFDVTRYVVPIVRTITGPPKIKLDLLLSKYVEPGNTLFNTNADAEATFNDFYISNFTYNKDQVSAELTMINYEREPFPLHNFTPAYFPGLF